MDSSCPLLGALRALQVKALKGSDNLHNESKCLKNAKNKRSMFPKMDLAFGAKFASFAFTLHIPFSVDIERVGCVGARGWRVGARWGALGARWGRVGCALGLGARCGRVGCALGCVWARWGRSGANWGALGGALGARWGASSTHPPLKLATELSMYIYCYLCLSLSIPHTCRYPYLCICIPASR